MFKRRHCWWVETEGEYHTYYWQGEKELGWVARARDADDWQWVLPSKGNEIQKIGYAPTVKEAKRACEEAIHSPT